MTSWDDSELLGMSECGQTLYKRITTGWNVMWNITRKCFSANNGKNKQGRTSCFLNTICWHANSHGLEVWIQTLWKWKDSMEWVSVWWLQVIETVRGDTSELCKIFKNSFSLFPDLGAHRPQQNRLSIFTYSIVAFLDLKNQISRRNSWLRHLNKLQITAFQGKCACFAVLGLYLWFRITFFYFSNFDHCNLFYIFSGPFFSILDSIVSQKKEHSLLFLNNLFDQSSTEGHLSKHWHCYRISWILVSGVYQNGGSVTGCSI